MAKQNQKFPFHFFFRFAAEGWGGRRREKNARKFFGFCTRESASVSEAHCQRNRGVRGSFKPPRAPRVRLVTCFGSRFGLGTIKTPELNLTVLKRRGNGRAEGTPIRFALN